MISRLFSARVFTLVFGLTYAVAVYGNYPLFRYYPLASRFSLYDVPDTTLGPAMTWYGWIATAAVVAALVTAVIPKAIGNRIPGAVFWIVPVAILGAAWYRERDWFLVAV